MNETSFKNLDLSEPIRRAVADMGFEDATEIQYKSIPLLQEGRDVIGRSQTGTGKTLAFGIPAIERIQTQGEPAGKAQVLVLCPTRELAAQACEEIRKLAKYIQGLRTAEIYGGEPMAPQIRQLKHASIVVGTPGRVMDHMRRHTLKLEHVGMVVLDEADEMLSMGFRGDIETILSDVPEERQTVLFSATMPDEIMALTRKYQKNPVTVQVDPKQVAVKSVRQYFCETELYQKPAALGALLQYLNPVRAIVFCNTKRTVDELCAALNRSGIFAASLHGDMEQPQRTRVMNSFKSGKTQVLIATDVAARGIDVSDIDYVFNYDIPQNTEYYVHRIGRTGRAGKAGKSVTLCEGRKQTFLLMGLAKSIKTFIRPMELPTEEEVLSAQYQNNLKKIADLLQSGTVPEQFDTMVRDLMQEGFTAEAVAAAALSDNFRTSLKRADIRLEEHKEHQGRKRSSAERKTAVSAHAAKKGTNAGTAPQAKQQSASKSGGRRRKRKRGGNGEPSGATDRMANISYIGGYTHSRGGN